MSLHLLPRRLCAAKPGIEQAAQASLWPIYSPAPRLACPNATWPHHASAWASIPQARATVPLPLRGRLADPLRRTPTRGLCVCLCPVVSLCIFLPLVRWGHSSQGLF